MSKPVVGIIGLGNAGSALAQSLSRHFKVLGFDVDPKACTRIEAHAVHGVEDLATLSVEADVALLSLPHPDVSRAVVTELCASTCPPKLVIETSTITPKVARELAGICRGFHIGFVDAAIGGGVQSMAEGRVTFLVGGAEADLTEAKPVIEAIAEQVHYLGPVGAGSGAKVVNNAVMHAVMVVLIEAAAMGKQLEIPTPKLVEILSRAEGLMRPLEHRLGERIAQGNYQAGMSVANARKDSMLALETALDLGIPLFATAAAHTPYEIAYAAGDGDLDYAVLARLWEDWCGLSLTH